LTDGAYRGFVKKQLALLVAALVTVLVLAGQLAHAAAGPGPNDIQDSRPYWASDGVHLAFERTAPNLQHVVTTTSAGKEQFVAWQSGQTRGYVGSRYFLVEQDGETTVTSGGRFAGPNAILYGVQASASPDGTQIAYVRGGVLYVVQTRDIPPGGVSPIPSPPERALATLGGTPSDQVGPAWSRDGRQIAVASGGTLFVVQADGSGFRALTAGANPSWAPDGQVLAFERGDQVWLIRADGTREYGLANGRFPQFSPFANTLAYISDRQHVEGGATKFQFALYVQPLGGVARKLVDDVHPYSPPRWSPTGVLIAVSAGHECRRWGIYVVHSSGGKAHRHSNLCRFDGTSAADTIHGSPYFDLINGNGGNDRLYGFRGNDKISGENGNDVIVGDAGDDFILAGPGDDRISGGTGDDVIIGGNGHDVIDCGPGNDTVEGAGPLDRIAKNCEHVRH
jgi:Ca2+-binding RTX toxin-like protein